MYQKYKEVIRSEKKREIVPLCVQRYILRINVPGEQTDDPNLDPVIFGRGPLTDVSSDASEEPNLKEADNADDADDADPTYDQIDSGGDTDYKPGRQKSGKGKGRGRGEASGDTKAPSLNR